MAKLNIYRKFATALIVSVLVSVGWIGYEVCLFMSKPYSNSRIIREYCCISQNQIGSSSVFAAGDQECNIKLHLSTFKNLSILSCLDSFVCTLLGYASVSLFLKSLMSLQFLSCRFTPNQQMYLMNDGSMLGLFLPSGMSCLSYFFVSFATCGHLHKTQ